MLSSMRSRVFASAGVLLLALVSPTAHVEAAKAKGDVYLDAKSAGEAYELQGEYVGDELAFEDGKPGKRRTGAQVIALGKNRYRLVLFDGGLPGAGWKPRNEPEEQVYLEGEGRDGSVALKIDYPHGEIPITIAKDGIHVFPGSPLKWTLKPVVRKSPTLGMKPPAGATVLFGGRANDFKPGGVDEHGLLKEGQTTKSKFTEDFVLHLEFRTPFKPEARGQGRGNSGVYILGQEIQVLDSFGLTGEANECGGFYKWKKPDVNMCLPPLQWQTYDIEYRQARKDADGDHQPARMTVRHNGVVIHDDIAVTKGKPGGTIHLQNHGNPVRYRNVWVAPLSAAGAVKQTIAATQPSKPAKHAKAGEDGKRPLHVHFISGAKEYQSSVVLKTFKKLLEDKHGMKVTASWGHDGIKKLDGLDALKDADVMLVFARRMKLGEEQMKLIRGHWEAGKGVVGIRTASHAFQKADNELFDRKVMGGNYQGHYGNEVVEVAATQLGGRHVVMEGVKAMKSKRLYKAGKLSVDAVVLQRGKIEKAEHDVTWVHVWKTTRTFYTSLGVPSDFESKDFNRMLVNAVKWVARRDGTAKK